MTLKAVISIYYRSVSLITDTLAKITLVTIIYQLLDLLSHYKMNTSDLNINSQSFYIENEIRVVKRNFDEP